jgi:hypothetical protein
MTGDGEEGRGKTWSSVSRRCDSVRIKLKERGKALKERGKALRNSIMQQSNFFRFKQHSLKKILKSTFSYCVYAQIGIM